MFPCALNRIRMWSAAAAASSCTAAQLEVTLPSTAKRGLVKMDYMQRDLWQAKRQSCRQQQTVRDKEVRGPVGHPLRREEETVACTQVREVPCDCGCARVEEGPDEAEGRIFEGVCKPICSFSLNSSLVFCPDTQHSQWQLQTLAQ